MSKTCIPFNYCHCVFFFTCALIDLKIKYGFLCESTGETCWCLKHDRVMSLLDKEKKMNHPMTLYRFISVLERTNILTYTQSTVAFDSIYEQTILQGYYKHISNT